MPSEARAASQPPLAKPIVVQKIRPGQEEQLRALYWEIYGSTVSLDYLRWFLHGCPWGPADYYLATEPSTGRLVGSYGLTRIKVRLKGQPVEARLCVDIGLIPEYRGHGAFTAMARAALADASKNGCRLALCFPNARSLRGSLEAGWKPFADIPFLALTPADRQERLPADVRQVLAFPKELDSFLARIAPRTDFELQKDHRYLNWRFSRPDSRYALYVRVAQGSIEGYLVFKRYHDAAAGIEKSHILDLQADDENSRRELALTAVALSQDCAVLNLWCAPKSELFSVLRSLGFEERGASSPLIVYFNDARLEPAARESETFQFFLGDNDVY